MLLNYNNTHFFKHIFAPCSHFSSQNSIKMLLLERKPYRVVDVDEYVGVFEGFGYGFTVIVKVWMRQKSKVILD